MKKHGGKVFEAAEILGCNWSEIIDFSANINPLGQPEGLKEALFADFDRTLHYPQIDAAGLKDLIGSLYSLPAASILPGAGSTPHLYLLSRTLDLGKVAIIGPAFAEYEAALNCAGITPCYILSRPEDNWLVTHETLERLWQSNPGAVFLANPANPTARLVQADILEALAEGCAKRGTWLIIDEAFIDFGVGFTSLLNRVLRDEKLIILRSLTKIFALPGLRLAFLGANPSVVATLQSKMEPWFLSSPAISAGHYCLSLPDYKKRTIDLVSKLRNRLRDLLQASQLGYVFPSEANYILMRLNEPINTQALIDHLFNQGILVRDASTFAGLEKGYLRFAVRPESELKALEDALTAFQSHKQSGEQNA